jgi:hypothetical protein
VIKVCTDENSAKPGDVIICNEEDTPTPQDIKVCQDDGRLSPCATSSELTLTGTDAPVNGSTYTANGVPPYSFTIYIESGSATTSLNGNVLTIDNVGTSDGQGFISVQDACNRSAQIDVRWPQGKWCNISACTCPFAFGSCTSGVQCAVTTGYTRKTSTYICCSYNNGCGGDYGCRTCPGSLPVESRSNIVNAEWHYSGYTCPGQDTVDYPC